MEKCIVCGAMAIAYNSQNLPMCKHHKTHEMINMKCPACGKWLDVSKSKYGTFFLCIDCGPISVSKLKSFGSPIFIKKS